MASATLDTIEAYNHACPPEAKEFKPFEIDHCAVHAAKIALVPAHRQAAFPRLSHHLRQLLHLRRREGRHPRARARQRRQGHARPLRRRRNGRALPPGLHRRDVGPARRRMIEFGGLVADATSMTCWKTRTLGKEVSMRFYTGNIVLLQRGLTRARCTCAFSTRGRGIGVEEHSRVGAVLALIALYARIWQWRLSVCYVVLACGSVRARGDSVVWARAVHECDTRWEGEERWIDAHKIAALLRGGMMRRSTSTAGDECDARLIVGATIDEKARRAAGAHVEHELSVQLVCLRCAHR